MGTLEPILAVLCNNALVNAITWLHAHQTLDTTLFATTGNDDVITLNLSALPSKQSFQYARSVLFIECAKFYTIVGLARGNVTRPDGNTENGNLRELIFALAADASLAANCCAEVRRDAGNKVVATNPVGYANATTGTMAELLRPWDYDRSKIEAVNEHWQKHRTIVPTGVHPPH